MFFSGTDQVMLWSMDRGEVQVVLVSLIGLCGLLGLVAFLYRDVAWKQYQRAQLYKDLVDRYEEEAEEERAIAQRL